MQLNPCTSSCFNSFPAKVQRQTSMRVWGKGQFRKAGWNRLLNHWSEGPGEKFSSAFPEYLWPLHRRWRCWKSRERPGASSPVLVFNSFSAVGSLFLFIWGISGIGALRPHWVLLSNRACLRHWGLSPASLLSLPLLPWLGGKSFASASFHSWVSSSFWYFFAAWLGVGTDQRVASNPGFWFDVPCVVSAEWLNSCLLHTLN